MEEFSRAEFLKRLGAGLAGFAGTSVILPNESFGQEVRRAIPITEAERSAVRSGPPNPYVKEANLVNHGPGYANRIAITYDDGPTPGVTDVILDELARRKIRATFFMIGRNVKARPDLARRVFLEGHEIGNHSFTHPHLGKLGQDRVTREIETCQDVVNTATNFTPIWFRPPYGSWNNKRQGSIAIKNKLGVAMWTVDPHDWKASNSARNIAHTVVSQTKPGAIILLHDLRKNTAHATPYILDNLQRLGFQFTTMSGFLGHPYA